jgi:hypothetical protein
MGKRFANSHRCLPHNRCENFYPISRKLSPTGQTRLSDDAPIISLPRRGHCQTAPTGPFTKQTRCVDPRRGLDFSRRGVDGNQTSDSPLKVSEHRASVRRAARRSWKHDRELLGIRQAPPDHRHLSRRAISGPCCRKFDEARPGNLVVGPRTFPAPSSRCRARFMWSSAVRSWFLLPRFGRNATVGESFARSIS